MSDNLNTSFTCVITNPTSSVIAHINVCARKYRLGDGKDLRMNYFCMMQMCKLPNDLKKMATPYSCYQDKCSCYEEQVKYLTSHCLKCHWN